MLPAHAGLGARGDATQLGGKGPPWVRVQSGKGIWVTKLQRGSTNTSHETLSIKW